MAGNIVDGLITIVVGAISTISKVPGFIGSNVARLNDFIYVRYFGLPFIVLGARQTGKTTLIQYLRSGKDYLDDYEPEPTAGGGDPVARFNTRVADETIRLNVEKDVGGEYPMWETDWIELFRETQPAGLIIMIDHLDPPTHKDALNFILQMIDEEENAKKKLRAILVLVNKSDLWSEEMRVDEIMANYKNEMRRAKLLANRYNLWFEIHTCSLLDGTGVDDALRAFLNIIRPKPKKVVTSAEVM